MPSRRRIQRAQGPLSSGAQWQAALTECLRKAAAELRAKIGDERLYAFALYTSGGGDFSYVCASANTEEGLEQVIGRYTAKKDEPRAKLERDLRWSACDWAYHDFSKQVSDLGVPDLGPRNERRIYDAMVRALQTADHEGAFGTGRSRDAVTIAILCGDMSEVFLRRGIERLNPPETMSRYIERWTSEPFFRSLAKLPKAELLPALVRLWTDLALDSESPVADEARSRGITACDVEEHVTKQGKAATPFLVEVIEQNVLMPAWNKRGTAEHERHGPFTTHMNLASSAAFALRSPIDDATVEKLQSLIAKRIASDEGLEKVPTLAENIARVLHTLMPKRFPKTQMDPSTNRLINASDYLAGKH
jgi:hypothetical protein